MAGHPTAVAAEAIATWLEGQEGISRALRGWPEREEDLDLTSGPVISVTQAGDAEIEACAPYPIVEASDPDSDDLLVTWRIGDCTVEFQLDVWAGYRAVRDQAAALLEAALNDDLPYTAGLQLELADYFDQNMGVELVSSRPLDDADAATTREWRQRMVVRCVLGICAQGRQPPQLVHVLGLTTEVQGEDVVEPDFTYDFDED